MAAVVTTPVMKITPLEPIRIDQGRSATLYDAVEHVTVLLDTVDLVEDPEQREAIERDLASAIEAEIRKVDSVAQFLAHCESQQQFAAEEIKRLQERKQFWARKEDRLKGYIQVVMESAGLKKLEGRTNTLSLRACPASVEVLDEAAVPEEYTVVKVESSVDKKAVNAALEDGIEIPGVRLITDRKAVVRK